jgi:hypothetical protein
VDKSDITGKPENVKVRKILWYSALGIALLFVILYVIPIPFPESIFGILLLLICIDVVIIAIHSRKFYNWSLVFLFFILTAIFFRRMRWPVTGILYTVGYSGLAIVSYFAAVKFLKSLGTNAFLKYIGFSSSIILVVVSMGILFKSMHWPMGGTIINAGLILFIPFLFAFVFTLPGSNYINWNHVERTVFFRVIVIPMTFIYVLCVMMLVLPDIWNSITRTQLEPFWMYDFELLTMPGLL